MAKVKKSRVTYTLTLSKKEAELLRDLLGWVDSAVGPLVLIEEALDGAGVKDPMKLEVENFSVVYKKD